MISHGVGNHWSRLMTGSVSENWSCVNISLCLNGGQTTTQPLSRCDDLRARLPPIQADDHPKLSGHIHLWKQSRSLWMFQAFPCVPSQEGPKEMGQRLIMPRWTQENPHMMTQTS